METLRGKIELIHPVFAPDFIYEYTPIRDEISKVKQGFIGKKFRCKNVNVPGANGVRYSTYVYTPINMIMGFTTMKAGGYVDVDKGEYVEDSFNNGDASDMPKLIKGKLPIDLNLNSNAITSCLGLVLVVPGLELSIQKPTAVGQVYSGTYVAGEQYTYGWTTYTP